MGLAGNALDQFMDEFLANRTGRIKAEGHRELLAKELDHRTRNLLATIQTVARQTFADTGDYEAVKIFGARLHAMAAANSILMQDHWTTASIRDVVEKSTSPFEDARNPRFSVAGPELSLGSAAALALAMAFHELCTNAAKYGALAAENGRIEVLWSVSEKNTQDWLEVVWKERGGPRVEAPTRVGFGSKIIKQVLAQKIAGEVILTYEPEGLICVVSAPLASVISNENSQGA